MPLLLCYNEEAVMEAARAFGNFSRSDEHRACMQASRTSEVLCLLLDHADWEVIIAVCGTIINITLDADCRTEFVALGGVRSLLSLLERCMLQGKMHHVHVTAMELGCKVLFNVLASTDRDVLDPLVDPGDLEMLEALLQHAVAAEGLRDEPALQDICGALLQQLSPQAS